MGREQHKAVDAVLAETIPRSSTSERVAPALGDWVGETWAGESETLDGNSISAAGYLRTAVATDGSSPAGHVTPALLPALAQWSRYELLAQIGQGGMGTVYKARDRQLGRIVAIKFIRAPDTNMVARFLQEARAQSLIEHANICKVYEVGEIAGRAYIAMQFIAGESLDRLQPALSTNEKVALMVAVCDAIEAAHQAGILHRDIKPSNIMVYRDHKGTRVPVVMDFGLARETQDSRGLTESGAVLGTPAYMSPEQARGDVRALDVRSDVYSLGATLFDVLSGSPPFADDTVVNILLQVVTKEAPSLRSRNPLLPVALDTICARCLAKDKEQRYASAKAVADDLRRTLNAERILAKRVSLWYRLKWRASQNRLAAGLVLTLLVSLVLSAGYGAYSRIRAQREAELLRELAQDSNEVEWLLRSAYQLPLHDIASEQTVVRQRISSLQQRLAQSSGRLAGLFEYAVGRGHLALHEFDAAEGPLRNALARGIDLPELHFALGRVLGERYQQQLSAARYSGDPAFFAARKKELDASLLSPALASLSRSRGVKLAAPEYLEGLIAFYQAQYDTGLQRAEAAFGKAPWLYEAMQLQGDILLARGMDQREHGDYAQAEQSLSAAAKRYQRAADIARSDNQVHEVLAETWIQLSRLPGKKPEDAALARTLALQAAESTIAAAPTRSSGYSKKAYALFWQALAQYQSGEDMQQALDELRRSAQAAVARNPMDAVALDVLGNSYDLAGSSKHDRGLDPMPDYKRAEHYLQQAVRANPRFPWAWNDTAANAQHIGNYLWLSGGNPAEYFQRTAQAAAQAMQLDAQAVAPYSNALLAYADWAASLVDRGEDPEGPIEQGRALARELFALNPRHEAGRRVAARLELTLANHLFDTGRDPALAIDRALGQLQEAAAIAPDHPDLEHSLATAYQMRARLRSERKQDPGEDFRKSQALAESCHQHNPELAACLVVAARGRMAQAVWAMARQLSPLPDLLEAVALSARAVQLNETDSEALYEWARARYELVHARGTAQPTPELGGVLHAIERALQSNPRHARSHALRGAALVMRAKAAPSRATQHTDALAAQASFIAAQKIHTRALRPYAEELAWLSARLDVRTDAAVAKSTLRATQSLSTVHPNRSSR